METKIMTKEEALADHFALEASEIVENLDGSFEADCMDYFVFTDEEADEKCKEYIKDSAWAFHAWFIISHTELPAESEELIKSFQEKCEDANDTILALIKDFDHFVEEAIGLDGRGHFLSSYDGNEIELKGGFYAYIV